MDTLTAGVLTLLIVSVCYTFLRFNSQLNESKERELKLKREIKDIELRTARLEGGDLSEYKTTPDGGSRGQSAERAVADGGRREAERE